MEAEDRLIRCCCTKILLVWWLNFISCDSFLLPTSRTARRRSLIHRTRPRPPWHISPGVSASATVLQKVKGFGIGGSARPQRSGLSESGEGFSATANETESSADPSRAQALGTLFKSEDEEIRELGSDEFLDTMRLWAPMSNFVVNEGNASSREEGNATRLVLQQMAEWKPPRSGSYLGKTPDWRFGAPVGAFKGGQLDAVACLEISESDGVVVRYIVLNPLNIGVEGNAADWLIKGMAFICRERLGMRLDIYPLMRVYDGRYYDAHKHLCEQNEVERTSL